MWKLRKKLIEVALPLEAINAASARGEVHSPRPPQYAAPVVGAASARGGKSRALCSVDG